MGYILPEFNEKFKTKVLNETIKIGNQYWLKRNMDDNVLPNGQVIPIVTDNAAWAALTTPGCCYYDNDSANGLIYGMLYNWYAIDLINAAFTPLGLHVPTLTECQTLSTYLGGNSVSGGKLKEAGTTHWSYPNYADNSSKFTMLPSGARTQVGDYVQGGGNGSFWSIDKYRIYFSYYTTEVVMVIANENIGRACRLIKNTT